MTKTIIRSFLLMILAVFITACGVDNKENAPKPDGPYSFVNATTPLTITKSGGGSCSGGTTSSGGGFCFNGGTSCASCGDTADSNASGTSQISRNDGMYLSVQLLKNGLVAPGESVQVIPFSIAYGALVNTVVSTDENGRAFFEYEAPAGSNYEAIKGQNITIQAVFLDPEATLTSTTDSAKVLVTQDFVLQFR